MALAEIRGGAHIDILSAAELGAELDLRLGPEARQEWWSEYQRAEAAERAKVRGIKPVRWGGAVNAQTVFLGGANGVGPESGYMLQVRLISCQVASSDTVQVFIASAAPPTGVTLPRLIQNWSTAGTAMVQTFNAGACMLFNDESIYLSAAAHNVTAFFVAGFQVPAERVGELA